MRQFLRGLVACQAYLLAFTLVLRGFSTREPSSDGHISEPTELPLRLGHVGLNASSIAPDFNTNQRMPCQLSSFPQELRPKLPTIIRNVDYHTLRERLEQIGAVLRDSGLERDSGPLKLDAARSVRGISPGKPMPTTCI